MYGEITNPSQILGQIDELHPLVGYLNNGIPNINLHGTGEPTSDIGADGQLYIQDINPPVAWIKSKGKWSKASPDELSILKISSANPDDDVQVDADKLPKSFKVTSVGYDRVDITIVEGSGYKTYIFYRTDETYAERYYRCKIEDGTELTFMLPYGMGPRTVTVSKSNINDEVSQLKQEIAENFDASKNYNVNDQVRYNGKLYVFTKAHSGAWNEADVHQFDNLSQPISSLSAMVSRNYNSIEEIKTEQTTQNDAIANVSKAQQIDRDMIKSIVGDWYTEDKVTSYANEVSVPSNAYPYAELQMVGGMSRRGINQFDIPTDTTLYNSDGSTKNPRATVEIDGDVLHPLGAYGTNGTCYMKLDHPITATGGLMVSFEYMIPSESTNTIINMRGSNTEGTLTTNYAITGCINDGKWHKAQQVVNEEQGTYYLWAFCGWTHQPSFELSPYFRNIQIESGSTAHDFEPYTPSLIDAKVDEVVSVGKNLVDVSRMTTGYINGTTGAITLNTNNIATDYYMPIKSGESVVLSANTVSKNMAIGFYKADKSFVNRLSANNVQSLPFSATENGYIRISYNYNDTPITTAIAETIGLQLEKSSTPTNYSPYHEPITKPIPQAIIDLCPNYGIGVNQNCYNYIDFENKKYHKRVGVVDLGTLTWRYVSSNARFDADIIGKYIPTSSVYWTRGLLVSRYESNNSPILQTHIDKTISGYSNSDTVYLYDSTYTDATAFKTAMNGVMLYYELATEEVIDLADVWVDDLDILNVEGNGTVKFSYENDDVYNVDVPSTILYQEKA